MKGMAAKEPRPPTTDRGAEITVGIDWLEFTVRPGTFDGMAELLCAIVPGEFVETDHGALGYRRMAVGPGQGRIFWGSISRPDEVHVQLKGEWCVAVPPQVVQVMLTWLARSGKPSRVDLAADDFGRRILPSEVDGWLRAGYKVSRARAGRYHFDYESKGETVQIGSRSSREMLRVYDKGKESGGRIESIRWELQTRDEAAVTLVQQLVELRWREVWRGRLVRFVDFKERREGVPVTRCARLPAFEALVGSPVKLRAYDPEASVPVLDQKMAYLKKYVGPLLSAVVAGLDGDMSFVHEMLKEGPTRWRWQHEYLARGGRNEQSGTAASGTDAATRTRR